MDSLDEELKGGAKLPSDWSSKAISFSSAEISLGLFRNLANTSSGDKRFHVVEGTFSLVSVF